MMKKKLQLNDLKVKSFITNMDGSDELTIKGGGSKWVSQCLCPFETEDVNKCLIGETKFVTCVKRTATTCPIEFTTGPRDL